MSEIDRLPFIIVAIAIGMTLVVVFAIRHVELKTSLPGSLALILSFFVTLYFFVKILFQN
jgi:uncharacterized membrane protein (UPF0136 family)